MMRVHSYILFLVLFYSFPLKGQSPFREKRYSYFDGLPSNSVSKAFLNPEHFLYTIGSKGISFFDGYRFTPLEEMDKEIVSQCIKNDTLYFEDSEALKKIKLHTNSKPILIQQKIFTDADPNNEHFQSLYVDNKNRIWCSDFNNIKYIDTNGEVVSYHIFPHNKHLIEHINFIEISDDEIWISTPNGVYVWHTLASSIQLHPDTFISSLQVLDYIKEPQGNFIISTDDQRLIWIDPHSSKILKEISVPNQEKITGFIQHGDHELFIYSKASLWKLSLSEYQFSLIHRLEDTDITYVELDHETGHFWLCTPKGLIQLIPPHQGIRVFQWANKENTQNLYIQSIVQSGHDLFTLDQIGNLWNLDRDKKWNKIFNNDKDTRYTSIRKIENRLLLLSHKGVYEWKEGKLHMLPLQNLHIHEAPINVLLTNENELWLLYPHGRIQCYTWPTLQHIDRKFRNDISFWNDNLWNDFAIDWNGRLWLAGWMPKAFGISYYDPKQEKFIEISDQHINPNSKLFVGDYYNRIFVSPYRKELLFSAFGGWNRVNDQGKIIQQVDALQYPFANNHLQGISEDKFGNVFFATAEGLHIYTPAKDKVLHITMWDGLPTNYLLHAHTILSDNSIAFGIENGLIIIDPEKIIQTQLINRLEITKILVNGKMHHAKNNRIKLNKYERNVSIFFSSLSYLDPNKIFYRYRIHPDEKWIDLGNNPEISLNHLSPGDYAIDVACYDHLGNQQDQQLQIFIEAPPTFTESKLFYALLLLASLSLAWGIMLYIISRQKREEVYKR